MGGEVRQGAVNLQSEPMVPIEYGLDPAFTIAAFASFSILS